MVLCRIVKFENCQKNSHYYFEKTVNDRIAELERTGCYIMNVRFEKHVEHFIERDPYAPKNALGELIDGDFFYAFILYSTKRHGIEPEDRSKPQIGPKEA